MQHKSIEGKYQMRKGEAMSLLGPVNAEGPAPVEKIGSKMTRKGLEALRREVVVGNWTRNPLKR